MKNPINSLIAGFMLLSLAVLLQPVEAACTSFRPFAANRQVIGQGSDGGAQYMATEYIYTLGLWCSDPSYDYYGYYPSCPVPSVSFDVDSVFWALGFGEPAVGQGMDSGDCGSALFTSAYAGSYSPAFLSGQWGAPCVDGCIDNAGATPELDGDECMVMLLADQNAGKGYFALLTTTWEVIPWLHGDGQEGAPPTSRDHTVLWQGFSFNGHTLAPIPSPQLLRVGRARPAGVKVLIDTPFLSELVDGLDLNCPYDRNAVVGYKLYHQSVPAGSGAPPDLDRSSGWTGINADSLSLGEVAKEHLSCPEGKDLYIAGSIVFDSGFETRFVSEPVGPIICGARNRQPARIIPASRLEPNHR